MTRIFVFLALVGISSISSAVTVGQFIDASEEFLDCNDTSYPLNEVCSIVQDRVNQKLADAGLSLTNRGILYSQEESTNTVLKNSCTRKTTLKRQRLELLLKRSASLNLSGNMVSEPTVFAISLPSEAYARMDLVDDIGLKNWFACIIIGEDNYYADAQVNIDAQLLAFLSLEPKYAISNSGEIVIELGPIFDLSINVDLSDLNFDIHGVSAWSGLVGNLLSLPNAFHNQVDNILNSESIDTLIESTPALVYTQDWAQGVILTNYGIGDPLNISGLVSDYAEKLANEDATTRANNYGNDVQRTVNSKIRNALALDYKGKAYFAFSPTLQSIPVTQAHKDLINPPSNCGKYYGSVSGSIMSAEVPKIEQFCGACGFIAEVEDGYRGVGVPNLDVSCK